MVNQYFELNSSQELDSFVVLIQDSFQIIEGRKQDVDYSIHVTIFSL